MSQKYYPLHVHTSLGSVGDSILGISEYVNKAKEYGLDALAITDHGSMSAMYEFAIECKKNNVKPIIGMEAYVTDDNSLKDKNHKNGTARHLVLLARTTEGLKNLLSIHNQAATEGFYYTARTDWDHLQKLGKGIIALSACVGGEIPQAILEDDHEKVANLIGFYKECFDEFYLELQPGTFPEQIKVNQQLTQYAKSFNVPLIVTNDIHYLTADDAKRHDYHVKLGRKKVTDDNGFIYPDTCYWFMNREDIMDSFCYDDQVTREIVGKAIDRAADVAARCSIDFSSHLFMPAYPVPTGQTEEEVLYRKCFTQLNRVIETKADPQAYVDRLNYELGVIKEKGFCGYFLVVQDYVNHARDNGIPVGPGRGSAAGSLVANMLGISQADPIEYGLLFERFLDPHREAVPDIDIDFAPGEEGREKMFHYAVEKYGYDHCALVSTIGIRHAKGAIHDAARILGYEVAVGNEIAKLIPDVYYGDDGEKKKDLDIQSSIEVIPELKRMLKTHGDIIDLAIKLEGLPASKSIHAAGILISPVSLLDKIPLIKSNKENVLATSLTLEGAEESFVKFDFLGLATLTVIKNTEESCGWSFDFQDDSLLHDDAVWDVIGSRNTTGLFQIASKTYKDRMPRLKPRSIEELAACLALVRGPAISAKTDEVYMQIIEGKKKVQLVHPLYDEITATTNGILIYQEQIMHLAVAFGMDLTTGYRIVKLSAKKKMHKLEEYRAEFIPLAAQHDCDEETANRIFDMIVQSGQYSFNKSHAVSYAMVTYCSAYLKVHYPLEYACSMLTNTYKLKKDKEYSAVLNDCRRQGIQFLPADINKSKWDFTIEDGCIRIGFCAVKGFGEKAAEVIGTAEDRDFASIGELTGSFEDGDAKIFNKKVMTVAIFSGMLDGFKAPGDKRHTLFEEYLALREKKEEVPDRIKLGTKNFEFDPINDDEATLEELFLSNQFIYDPANGLESFSWDEIETNDTFTADGYIRTVKKTKTKTLKQMAFAEIATGDGIITTVVFPETWDKLKKQIKPKRMVEFCGKKQDKSTCILQDITAAG